MDEITAADVAEDTGHLTRITAALTAYLRERALEWYGWDSGLEVTSDGYTIEIGYPFGALDEGRRKIQASVLKDHIGKCFDTRRLAVQQ